MNAVFLSLSLTVSGLLSQEAQNDIASCKLHMGLQLTPSMNQKIFTSLIFAEYALARSPQIFLPVKEEKALMIDSLAQLSCLG